LTDRPGVDEYGLERLRGFAKNGGTAPGGGATSCRFAFLQGYGDERVCAFALANANIDADPLLDVGLLALAETLGRRPGSVPRPAAAATTGVIHPAPATTPGLFQTVFWDHAGVRRSASQGATVVVRPVLIAGVDVDRTDLLGTGLLAGSKTPNDVVSVELRGFLSVTCAGDYRFRLSSDDGALLWIDDNLLIDNSGDHPLRSAESEFVRMDGGGSYPIRVRWCNSGGGGGLYLEWRTRSGLNYEPIPAGNFTLMG
jgi:hypothetical protein